ncbi:MAG: DUF5615 family PIN-like protein [Planctomycetaceae bacterium]|nr:DUF5615 family PIN-like protein [Planctomycetaceae bacterium]
MSDESLRSEVGDLFRQRGDEVATVYDQGLRGREDHEIAEVCRSEGRILRLAGPGLLQHPSVGCCTS